MKTKHLPVVLSVCVVVCVAAAIGMAVFHSSEASMAVTLPLKYMPTEFSTDDGATWKPFGTGRALYRTRGDVVVRGHFNYPIMEGWVLNFYLQHLQMELWVNEDHIVSFGKDFKEIRPEWCTDIWMCYNMPEISMEDVVEFRLNSLHPNGALRGAYHKTLSNIRVGDPFYIYQSIVRENNTEQYAGLTLMIIGIVLFFIAFVALWMKSPMQKTMMYTALFAVGEGLFWIADAAEIAHYVYGSISFFSTGRFVSRMLCLYALFCAMAELVNSDAKRIAKFAAYANGLCSIVYLMLNMAEVVTFCETEVFWYSIQVALLLIGLGCCVWEFVNIHKPFWKIIQMLTLALAYAALLKDLGTVVLGWSTDMDLSQWVCGAVAAFHSAALMVQLPASYSAIRRAEKLSDELHNSRIVLAMSQIRTHFIFNVLNAISSLCKSDPDMADVELVRFSRYLRNNIDIMQEDHPIPFEKALDHMHNYVDLEQLRFGEKIILDENYEYVDFSIPSLVMQPLVENAIKHGLLPKPEGGTIRVSTSRHGNNVLIEIADDGIGFDTHKKIPQTSVGLSNVRFRVEQMMNGRMQVESKPGKGTLVRLWLPLGKEESSFTLSV